MINDISWRLFDSRAGRPKPWSKSHKTSDERVTLCGLAIPTNAYDHDMFGSSDRCAKCAAKAKTLRED